MLWTQKEERDEYAVSILTETNPLGSKHLVFDSEEELREELKEKVGMTDELVDELLENGKVDFFFNEWVEVELGKPIMVGKDDVRLDIDDIPPELYDMLLDEFKRQHGEGDYIAWKVIARKEAEK